MNLRLRIAPFLKDLVALLLGLDLACASTSGVSLTDLSQIYDGSPKQPGYTAPEGVEPSFHFSEASAEGAILFRRSPEQLEISYPSLSFAAQPTMGVGELLRFEDPENRLISEVEVVLVTWAKAGDYPDRATLNPQGYLHTISIDLYAASENNRLTHIESVEEDVFVPWRPLTMEDGSAYTYNGFAFRALIRLPEPIAVPERTMILVSYNTARTGFAPIGIPGPYDQLNLGLKVASQSPVTHGIDENPRALLWVKQTGEWAYPMDYYYAPMLSVHGPKSRLPGPPTDAGEYQVTAVYEIDGMLTELTETFTILPAPAEVHFGATEIVVDGNPKAIEVTTNPPDLPVEVLYNGSPDAPSEPGRYQVTARILSLNHAGESGILYRLGHDYPSWLAATAPSLPAEKSAPTDDPDLDGWSNLQEYALQLDPVVHDHAAATSLLADAHGLWFRFRRNPDALDLTFEVQMHTGLSGSWTRLDAEDVIALPEDAPWVSIPVPDDGPHRFFRLSIETNPPPPLLSDD